jgi:hypothetical protein
MKRVKLVGRIMQYAYIKNIKNIIGVIAVLNLKANVLNESYNLKLISVTYSEELNKMFVLYPSLGEMLMQVDIEETKSFYGKIAPKTLDVNEWKEFFLSTNDNLEFLHERMIKAIVRNDLIITNSLKMKEHQKTKKYLNEIMDEENDYDAWLEDAIHEFRTGEWYEDDYGFDYEICENGDVHLGNFHIIKGAVTSFEEWVKLGDNKR